MTNVKPTAVVDTSGTVSVNGIPTVIAHAGQNVNFGVRITDVTCGLKLISRRCIPLALKLPSEDMHAELIVGLARGGARVHEVKITVLPREAGTSMYHLYKGLFYPAKTLVCLLGQLIFMRGKLP